MTERERCQRDRADLVALARDMADAVTAGAEALAAAVEEAKRRLDDQ